MGGAILGVVVVVVIIVAALAGYFAASSSISASTSTTTEFQTTTLPAVTSTQTSVSTATATVTQTNTVSVSGTVTVTSTGTVTSTNTATVTSTATTSITTTSTQTTIATPVLPPKGASSLPSLSAPIAEAGSSLVAPLFQLWAGNFTTVYYPNIQVNTAAGGSGAGQTGVEAGTLQIGGSDPFLSNAQVQAYPNILNIAVAVSAQQVNYNLPGLTHPLNFTGNVLGGIYNGTITYWDAAAIKAINAGDASQLPHQLIVPIHRSDSSGDTNLFTTYLSATSASWAKNFGAGNTVSWANVPGSAADSGNSGMLTGCSQTQYSIAYIGISYENGAGNAVALGLGTAKLQNLAGNFVQETQANIQSAVNAQYLNTPPSERYSLIFGPGATSYPIVNYEYALVQTHQGSQALATDLKALLDWCTLPNYGNSPFFLNQVGFVQLPNSIAQLSWAQIAEITV